MKEEEEVEEEEEEDVKLKKTVKKPCNSLDGNKFSSEQAAAMIYTVHKCFFTLFTYWPDEPVHKYTKHILKPI